MALDEAGSTADRHFVGAAFATMEPDAWRERIEKAIRYPYSLHFQKLPSRPDERYRATKMVLALLRRYPDWYAHFLHVDRSRVNRAMFSRRRDIEFNYWMGLLIKRRTSRTGRCYRVIVAERERTRGDRYLPEMLQGQLDERAAFEGGAHVQLDLDFARHDRLLQVADLIGSATRQLYEPSGNRIKEEIAADVAALVRPRGGLILPGQRLYAWHWRPSQVDGRTAERDLDVERPDAGSIGA